MATAFLSIFVGGIVAIAGLTGSTIHSVVQGKPDHANQGSTSPESSSGAGVVTGGKLKGKVKRGKVSWFGGPGDPGSGNSTASGLPVSHPGIAVYNHETLGGWWRLRFPNGRVAVLQQTDIGPAPWTGRLFDITYSALHAIGYSEKDFPTNSTIEAEYLGKKKP